MLVSILRNHMIYLYPQTVVIALSVPYYVNGKWYRVTRILEHRVRAHAYTRKSLTIGILKFVVKVGSSNDRACAKMHAPRRLAPVGTCGVEDIIDVSPDCAFRDTKQRSDFGIRSLMSQI